MYMKIRYSRNHRFTILATVAALGAFAPALRAELGQPPLQYRPEQGHEAEQQHHEAERGRPPVAHGTVVVEHGTRLLCAWLNRGTGMSRLSAATAITGRVIIQA